MFKKVMGLVGTLFKKAVNIFSDVGVSIKDGDIAKVKAHSKELREFGEKTVAFADFLDEAVTDNKLDFEEINDGAAKLKELIGEADDILDGKDD